MSYSASEKAVIRLSSTKSERFGLCSLILKFKRNLRTPKITQCHNELYFFKHK